MLVKLGVVFEEVFVPLSVEGSRAALYQHSPAARVPVLRENGLVIWDTMAIAEYLAESHPHLWPQDRSQRSLARSVAAEMHSGFMALRQMMPMNCRAENRRVSMTPELKSNIQRVQDIWTDCREAQSDEVGPWLFGPFTIADAMYAPVVFRFRTYGVSGNAAVAQYMTNVLQDPHVIAWHSAACAETAVIEEEEVGR